MKRRVCVAAAVILALSLAVLPGLQEGTETLSWKAVREETVYGDQAVCAWPRFELNGATLSSEALNDLLFREAEIGQYLDLAPRIGPGSQGLKLDYTLYTVDGTNRFLSLVLSAKGRMPAGRPGQKWYPFVFDLLGGGRLDFGSLFPEGCGAEERIEAYIEAELEENLSDYMENRELFPVPYDRFAICGQGLLFFYDYAQLSFLSGYSGQILIPWHILEGIPGSGDPDWRTAAAEMRTVPDGAPGAVILAAAAEGSIPGLPLQIGTPLDTLLESFRSAADPGYWYGGNSYETEDARLYRTLLLTDEKEEALTGIWTGQVNMAGLITGISTLEECAIRLGPPDRLLETDDNSLYAPLFGAGTALFYSAGDYSLILYAGEGRPLDAVLLVPEQKG